MTIGRDVSGCAVGAALAVLACSCYVSYAGSVMKPGDLICLPPGGHWIR
jgi:hypothetical protein